MRKTLQQFLTRNRGLVVFLFAVPVSFVYQSAQNLRNWYFRNFQATNKLHDRKVTEIQALVKQGAQSGKQMCTARKPWMTMSIRKATFKKEMVQIPIDLKNILDFDPENGIVRVEPMVTMGDITHYLIPKGYALAVQVEMDDLTVGGLCMGVGIETTSHRYGFLFETIAAYEIVTAEGELIRATADAHPDLFHNLPWSHGTLGFLVAVELQVVPIRSHMRVRYIPTHSQEEFYRLFQELSQSDNPPSYLEGLVYSPDEAVIMCGELDEPNTSEKRKKINAINRWYKPWYYTHVARYLEWGEGEEYLPIRHYFHRHTPSVFFQLKDLIPFGNQGWYRWLFAWMGAPKISLMKLTFTRELRKQAFENRVAQDILIPMQDMAEALDHIHPRYGIYPMWICPVRMFRHAPYEGLLPEPEAPSQMYVDIGIYGIPAKVPSGNWDSIREGRALEALSLSKRGFHMLYADMFMNRAEFEQMFNHRTYRAVRAQYKADQAFPEIYDKVVPESWLVDLEEEATKRMEAENVTAPQMEDRFAER